MKRLILLLIVLLPFDASANGAEAKTLKLFEVQGVLSFYQGVLDQSRSQAKEEARQIMDQMLARLNPSKDFQDKFLQAAEKYVNAVLTDRSAEQIVEVLIKYYSTKFAEEEIDRLIVFYSSELGKKDAAVSKDSYQYLMQYYKTENDRIRISATNDFVNDLQSLTAQCKCAKQPTPKKNQ